MDLSLYSQICSFGCLYEKKGPPKADLKTLAEGEGFEPSLPGVPVKRFSRPPHSAALPPFQNMYQPPKELVKKKAPKQALSKNHWRRDGDSNPRYAFGVYTISNRAPSASSVISPLAYRLHRFHVFSRALMQRLSILHHLIRTHKRKILIVFAIFCNLQRHIEQRAHHLVGQHILLRSISE